MTIDLTQILGNLSQSLLPVQALVTGLAYLIGILFVIHSIGKFRKIGDARASGGGGERMFVPIAYFLGGAALIFLPSVLQTLQNTAFGVGSALEYGDYNPYNLYDAMKRLIQTVGIIWFFRGCVLLTHASEPGVKEGPKGLTFLIAGILAMNFESTIGALNYSINHLIQLTLVVKGSGS